LIKIGPVDAEIHLLNLKKKKLWKVKYTAQLASLPSWLKMHKKLILAKAK